MRKFFKISGIVLVVAFVMLLVVGFIIHEPAPTGKPGVEAEQLTDKIERALNKVAWDTTNVITWTFSGSHHYLWDKKRDFVQVEWGKNRVIFQTKTQQGIAYHKDVRLFGDDADKKVQKAWKNFANDSFWLIAPYKLRDPGTERSIVVIKEDTCLKVHYTSGGVTPGDSYVWLLKEDGTPKAWKLWVKIIPIGGIKYGWNDWVTTSTGARIATLHKGIYNIKITNLSTGMSVKEVYSGQNPFDVISF